MSQRVSYAEVLRRQAAQVDNVADQYALVMDGGEHDTSEVQPARLDAAALRALATLVEEAERMKARYGAIPGTGSEPQNLVAALAAGFDPDGPR